MKQQLFENPVELRRAVPAPHFNDRRVVQRAQRVVPLNEIRTKLRMRQLWFLSWAFALAMMLGAASALVAVRVKRIAVNREISQIEEPETAVTTADAQPESVQLDQIADSIEAPLQQPTKPIVTAPKRPEPLAQRPRVVGRDHEPLSGYNGEQPSEDEQLQQIREAVLYEQWQERRARRAARRERRNRAGDRDLSHVDEIFEGPRRPERP